MENIMREAGHGRFKITDVIIMELDILKALKFKLQTTTLFDRAMT
jgi:hypothetical protein